MFVKQVHVDLLLYSLHNSLHDMNEMAPKSNNIKFYVHTFRRLFRVKLKALTWVGLIHFI